MKIDEVLSLLERAELKDLDPKSGRLFAYVYETGDENIRKVAEKALLRFAEKNLLDFHGFQECGFLRKGGCWFC